MMASEEILAKYTMTIGIECHVQLATDTKLFSGANNDARNKKPNEVIVPIDFGLPGMLPVLNKKAVELAIRAGTALNAPIAQTSRFDRKHYFYPDLPKGYQITQMYEPIILAGYVDVPLEDGSTIRVRIHHAHMEEDAGKLTHYASHSLVDLNRAGTPLIEIVSEPDIHSAQEAKAFATELHHLMVYAGVTQGDLYQGNMRFDVNVSVAPLGATILGTRAEVKNLNSFRSVEKAADYEFKRQVQQLEAGELVVQETRGWDDASQKTTSQRSKEDAQDYRYMPDADIPPVVLTEEQIAHSAADVPALPPYYRDKWQTMQLDRSVIESLLAEQKYAVFILAVQQEAGDSIAKRIAHWLVSALGSEDEASDASKGISLAPERFIPLGKMVEANELSSTAAKEVFVQLLTTNKTAKEIAESSNLLQISDESAISLIIDEVLADPKNDKAVADIRDGNDKVIGYLVGQIMKNSQGKANPALAQKLLRQKIAAL